MRSNSLLAGQYMKKLGVPFGRGIGLPPRPSLRVSDLFTTSYGQFISRMVTLIRRNSANSADLKLNPFDGNVALPSSSTSWYSNFKYYWPADGKPSALWAVWPMFFSNDGTNNPSGCLVAGDNNSLPGASFTVAGDKLRAGIIKRAGTDFVYADDDHIEKLSFLFAAMTEEGTAYYNCLKGWGESGDEGPPNFPGVYNTWSLDMSSTLWGVAGAGTAQMAINFYSALFAGRSSRPPRRQNGGKRNRRRRK
jgi:hypothetical protein